MKADHERVTKLLTDTVTLLCKNGLSYDRELRIQGLLGITVDSNEVFLVPINDSFNGSSSSTLAPSPLSVANSAATSSSQSRKCSGDDIVDLTRLVETPNIHAGVQPSQLPCSISPMHRGTPARPRSAGSATQTRSQAVAPTVSNLTSTRHSQALARQPPFSAVVTCGHCDASAGRRNSTERLTSANGHQNSNALRDSSAVHPGQRPHGGYIDSIHNLMLTCERQLAPRCCSRGHAHRQVPPPDWTGTDQQHSMQHRQMHQSMAAVGGMSAAAADLAVGRAGSEQFGISPHLYRQPANACIRRADVNPLRYMHTSTAVAVVGPPPPALCRQTLPGVPRPVYQDYSRYAANMQQLHAAAEMQQLTNNAAYFQPPAKRHAPNHSPRQAVQCVNPAFVQSQLPYPHGYFSHGQSTLLSQQTCSIADPHAVDSLALSNVSSSQASSSQVTSSLDIKPLSSPVQSGCRSRSRHVEHIDLCDDDETADSGIHIPVSSIVIQPDNAELPAEADEADRSSTVSVNASASYDIEFETVVENMLSDNDLPQLSHIHEIVPLDDGLDNEGDEVSIENAGQSTSASFSAPPETIGLPDNEQSSALNHLDTELSAAQLDISGDQLSTFSHNQIGIDSQLARLSADESRQMTELYFDTEDSNMHDQT